MGFRTDHRLRAGLLAGSLTIAAAAGVLTPQHASAATWTTPGFVRSVGGTGPAGVYAWGIAFNGVTNQVEVSDYWNFEVRSYSTSGQQLAAFYQPPSDRAGQPEGVAVDPRNGDVWVAENGTNKPTGIVAHFASNGTYINQLSTGAGYLAWLTLDDFGHLFILNGHLSGGNTIQEYDVTQASMPEIAKWGSTGSNPGQIRQGMGLATDAAGDVFMADAGNSRISEYHPSGSGATWVQDIYATDSTGLSHDLRGLTYDQNANELYVSDAANYRIVKFAVSGNTSTEQLAWGAAGSGDGQFGDGARQITVDASGNVWAADYSNFRFEEFSSTGGFLAVYPSPAEPPAGGFLSEARDVAINPADGSTWVADSWSDRFEKYSSTGAFEGTWGFRNSRPPYGMDYPRGIGVDPQTGNVWVADTRDHYIRIYDETGKYITSLGSGYQSCGAGSFAAPMDIQFFNGKAYIGDYWCNDLQILSTTTYQQVQGDINTQADGVAVDPATGNIWIVNWNDHYIRVYNSSGGYIGYTGGYGTGCNQFHTPWGIDIINGYVYVTDANLDVVKVLTTSGSCVGQWGGKGTGAFQFINPSGITHDSAGNIYVADANNGRVQVFSESVAMPSGDTVAPALTVTAPVTRQVFPGAPVYVTGTATDNVGLGGVRVAIHNATTGMWWDAFTSVWKTTKTWNLAAPVCSSTTSWSWSFAFIGEVDGDSYGAQVQVVDTSGNATMGTVIPFSVT